MNIPHYEILYGMSKKMDSSYLPKTMDEKHTNTGKPDHNSEKLNKQDKQDTLKQVLKETMDLTMTLKEQLKILKRKGIHSKQTQPKKAAQKHH